MAELGATTVTSITSSTAASGATELVRLGELTTLFAAHVPNTHTHTSTAVTDFDESSLAAAIAALQDSTTVTWTSSSTNIQANVVLKSGGGLTSDGDGVYVSFGSAAGTAAEGNHTHADLHDAVTVTDTDSVTLALSGQELSANVALKAGGSILSDSDGIYLDPDAIVAQSSHPEVTVTDSTTVSLTLGTEQELSADVILGTPGSNEGTVTTATGGGIVVSLGSTATTAAAGNHTHSEASTSAAGFLSASDKTKLDAMAASLQAEQAVQFHAADYMIQGDYVGGKVKWSQSMQLTNIDVVCKAPQASNVSLAIEIDGSNVVTGILIPTGTENEEVTVTLPMTDVFVTAGDYVRIVCESGVSSASEIEQAASEVNVSINALPALTNVPEVKLNCGGSATSPYADDGYYDIGSTSTTTESIDISGVTSAAPEAVYQSIRYYYASSNPVTYTIPYLGRGIEYKVRLHFAEIYFDSIGDQVFDILVTGEEEHTQSNYDVISAAGGTKYKAVVKEFTGVRASSNGIITIKLTPVAPNFRWAINAIEVIQDV